MAKRRSRRCLKVLAGRREHVGASADLRAVMAEVSEQAKVLDGIVRYRFGDNAELMGAWASVHSVVGPFRTHGEPPAGSVTPAGHKPGAGGRRRGGGRKRAGGGWV